MGLKGGLRRSFKGGFKDESYFSSFLTPLKRFRVAFSCLWSGEHVFVHSLRRLQGGFEEKLKGGFKGGFRGA